MTQRSPLNTMRLLQWAEQEARVNNSKFMEFDRQNDAEVVGNAKYMVVQAVDYHTSLEAAKGADEDHAPLYRAHAKSELSRVLALALRECTRWDWDFLEVLTEGVIYETDILKTRTADTAKYRAFAKYGLEKLDGASA